MSSGLCVVLHSFDLHLDLCFINLYGPYIDREVLWNNLSTMDCFSYPNLVVGGDLNFSLGHSEVWGVKARVDVLTDFFTHLFEGLWLIDIIPLDSIPTCSNHRIGSESISKRLDKLFLSADFLDRDFLLKQWIGCGGDSDHQLVFLHILPCTPKAHCPFKFNACWLENIELVDLLKASWKVFDALSEVSPASQFGANLKKLKDVSTVWSVNKKAQDIKDLVNIERELKNYIDNMGIGFNSEMEKLSMIDLESCKRTILCDREKEA